MGSQGKIIGVGFQKTGTSTLGQALELLGYEVCGVQWELAESLIKGDMGKIWELADCYEAFQDNPWPLLFREMDQRYPGSRFILTMREEDRWIRSVTDHLGKNSNRMREYIYEGYGSPKGNEERYLERYRRHNKEVQDYFEERPDDLLIMNFEAGDGWDKLCAFLGHEIPDASFPHANPGTHGTRRRLLRKLGNRFRWLDRKLRKD